MKTSRQDVAKRAGVSEATVSYVFSGKRYVSESLVRRVLDASEALDYVPDMVARSMVMKATKSIGVLTSDISSPLQMEVIKGMQTAAMQRGYFVNVCGGTENLECYIDNFISRRMDGVFISVMASLVGDRYIRKLADRGIGVIVTSTRKIVDDRVCGFELDLMDGMQKMIEYLYGLGHRKIVYVSAFDEKYQADIRIKAFRRGVARFGDASGRIVMGEYPYESNIEKGIELTNKLFDRGKDFTALICTNDMMAFGAIKACNDRGIRVPDDVSVAGIDNIAFSRAFHPALTTLDHGGERYGKRIFEILYDNIVNKVVRREMFVPELIIRDSCAGVRAD